MQCTYSIQIVSWKFLSPQLLWLPLVHKFYIQLFRACHLQNPYFAWLMILLCESIRYRAVKIPFENQEWYPTNRKLQLCNLLYLAIARCSGRLTWKLLRIEGSLHFYLLLLVLPVSVETYVLWICDVVEESVAFPHRTISNFTHRPNAAAVRARTRLHVAKMSLVARKH